MSTTADREIAIQYSGAQGQPEGNVLEIETGAVDRGCCIQEYSQYPGEREYLWLPLSFVEPNGQPRVLITDKGLVNIYQVKMIPNLKAGTVEEARERKKATHLTAFKYLIVEVRDDLQQLAQDPAVAPRQHAESDQYYTVDDLTLRIVEQCKERMVADAEVAAEEFADDVKFQALVKGMLDVKTMALCKFNWWLRDASQSIKSLSGTSLLEAMRGYMAYLMQLRGASGQGDERKKVALELVKLRGLLQGAMEEESSGGETALVVAAADGRSADDLLLLIEAGASVNPPTQMAPLAWTAKHGYAAATALLIQMKADVHVTDKVAILLLSSLPAARDHSASCPTDLSVKLNEACHVTWK